MFYQYIVFHRSLNWYTFTMENKNELQQTAFGMGCFWQSEESFREMRGVKETAVGFMGGTVENPRRADVRRPEQDDPQGT